MKTDEMIAAANWKSIICARLVSTPYGMTEQGDWVPVCDAYYLCLKFGKIFDWNANGDPIETPIIVELGPFWAMYTKEPNEFGALKYVVIRDGIR
jgi:hypothetical protein